MATRHTSVLLLMSDSDEVEHAIDACIEDGVIPEGLSREHLPFIRKRLERSIDHEGLQTMLLNCLGLAWPESVSEPLGSWWVETQRLGGPPGRHFDTATGFPIQAVHREFGLSVTLVPSGTYLIGYLPDLRITPNPPPLPRSHVEVGAFWIGVKQIRVQEYSRVWKTGSLGSSEAWIALSPDPEDKVGCLTYPEAQAFCSHLGGRLPTEIEWEIAGRGSDGRRFPWGDGTAEPFFNRRFVYHSPSPREWRKVFSLAGFAANDGPSPPMDHVGQAATWEEIFSGLDVPTEPSPFGVQEMFGEVGTWCTDEIAGERSDAGGRSEHPIRGRLRWPCAFDLGVRQKQPGSFAFADAGVRLVVPLES